MADDAKIAAPRRGIAISMPVADPLLGDVDRPGRLRLIFL
jgi:hypothetical protein